MKKDTVRRAEVPIDLVQALVPWLHLDGERAIGSLRIEPQRLVATDGHRMACVAPEEGATWCGEAFSVPRKLLVDALTLAYAPRPAVRSIDQILSDEPAKPINVIRCDLIATDLERTVQLNFSDEHRVRISYNRPTNELYPNVDAVMDYAEKTPVDRGGWIGKYVSLNPAFLLHCYHVAKVLTSEPGVSLTGWSDADDAPIYLQTIDKRHRGKFALMLMRL